MSITYNKESFTRADFPDDRTYEAACLLQKLENTPPPSYPDPFRVRTINTCRFILEDDCLAAKYETPKRGFRYKQAVEDHFELPCTLEVWDSKDSDNNLLPNEILTQVGKHDPALALKIWLWMLDTFMPYLHIETGEYILLIEAVLEDMESFLPQEVNDLIVRELEHNSELLDMISAASVIQHVQYDYIIYYSSTIGKCDNACRIINAYLDNTPEIKVCRRMFFDLVSRFCDFESKEAMQKFETEIWYKVGTHPYWNSAEGQSLRVYINDYIADYYMEYDQGI